MDGKIFRSYERYDGPKNKSGQRSGQGKLYCKKEGYESKEYLLYKGIFKNNAYHGAGTLYWEESDEVVKYHGRFRSGLRHGRGSEYNEQGIIIYQGVYRSDKREGVGKEYFVDEGKSNSVILYQGEFLRGHRDGFGICYMGQIGHTYIGSYVEGKMHGIGIYIQPNGDLFEGIIL